MKSFSPPYLGACYYPEVWPLKQVDEDIALMKEMGLNVVRINDFAWSCLEPQPGKYDFDWLHRVVNKLAEAGIAVIMCTPTCCPPIWLVEQYPEVLVVNDEGQTQQHGSREHACPNNPVYRDHCRRIVTRLAEEFGESENIIGWQIDNEMYPCTPDPVGAKGKRGCCCPTCHSKFQDAMRKKFVTIEALNEAWGTNLWSQTYQSFSQLPIPSSKTWHHPSLSTAWMVFQADNLIEFCGFQADILHSLTTHPLGTDMMPLVGMNYHKIHRKLDVVQLNHTQNMDVLWQVPFWLDLCRPVKDRPFWNTETSTCWSGTTEISNGYKEPGFCRANSWLPIALGGEANLYWLWRAHRSGQELMYGSVVDSCGRGLYISDEVKQLSADYSAASEFINGTRCEEPGLAMHYSALACWIYHFQSILKDFEYNGPSFSAKIDLIFKFYRPLTQAQFRMDIIDPAASLEQYRVVCTPFLPALDEANLRERLKPWIENGGKWIVGPMSDMRTVEATKFTHSPFGSLEEWAGVYCKYQLPGDTHKFALRWADGDESAGSLWQDGLEPRRDTEALATYTEGPLKGLAAATRRKMGKGEVIMLGTVPSPENLQKLILDAGKDAGVAPVAEASSNLLVVPRQGAAGKGLMVVELENRPASIHLQQPAVDLLTGKQHSGKITLDPYSVMALKY